MPASLRPVALITGASSGIGRQFALDYAAKGFDLVIVARSRDALDSLAGEVTDAHGADVHAGDLSQASDVATLVEAIAELPRLDHVIFSAGSAPEGDLTRIDPAALRSMIDLNIAALTLVNQAAIIRMRAASRGVIINIASVAGYQATPYLAAYGASKSYVRLFSEAISEENRKHGIRVLSVSPGDTVTPMNPGAAKGKRQPQDVVDTAWAALGGSAPSVVDGRSNRMLASLSRVLPTRTGLRIAEKMFRDKA